MLKKNKEKNIRSLLTSSDAKDRLIAAEKLSKIKSLPSRKLLVEAIYDPKNKKYKGSMVYALRSQDCSELLALLVQLALSDVFEVQNHALDILKTQKFKSSTAEIKKVQKLILRYRNSTKKCPDWKLLLSELNFSLKRNVIISD